MANSLLESYKGRLAIAEKYYAQQNNGAKLSNERKMITATCLNNVAKFINEAFANSVGTQRSDLGKYKIFSMDITNITMPNLVINDLLKVVPMTAMTGYLYYLEFALGTRKGTTGGFSANNNRHMPGQRGDQYFNAMSVYGEEQWDAQNIINSPFTGFGEMTEGRANYTGQAVIENLDEMSSEEESDVKEFIPIWTPVVRGAFVDPLTKEVHDFKYFIGKQEFYGDFEEFENKSRKNVEEVSRTALMAHLPGDADKVAYKYDNEYIPATQLPTVVARMKGITLQARVRRIAIYYSQLAAYQAKNDYGMDFESTIAQQAQAELQYEIDAEAVYMLMEAANASDLEGEERLEWVDEAVDTISYSMKAESFARVVAMAKNRIYKRTHRFMPTWMLVGPDVMPILNFVPGFSNANASVANGAYIGGTLDGMKVIVSPLLGKECILGLVGADGVTATGVYAPWLPIIPTQLLGFADGTMSQGFSTAYDMKILNPLLLTKIDIIDGNNAFFGQVELVKRDSEGNIMFNGEI